MFYAFSSPEDINRVIAATKQVERSRPFLVQGRQRLRPPSGAVPLFVRSTGTEVDTDFADGFVVTFDDNGDHVDQGAVYLTTADGFPPAAGIYFGRITGRHESSPGIGPLPVVRISESSESFFSCTGKKWWGGLRSDAGISFAVIIKSTGGACACVDGAFTTALSFSASSWTNAIDQLDVCGNGYGLNLTAPAGVPTLTLTDVDGGSGVGPTMTVAAICYGDGWAEFAFPGGPTNQSACTDPVDEGCDSDNSFVVRVDCLCLLDGFDGPGWYCVLNDAGTACVPVFVTNDDTCTDITICSGPYETEEAAEVGCTDGGPFRPGICAERNLPAVLWATFSSGNTPCPSNGETIPIFYDPDIDMWVGSATHSGATSTVRLSLTTNLQTLAALTGTEGASQSLERSGSGGCDTAGETSSGAQNVSNCDPFSLSVNYGSPGAVAITEVHP